MSSVNTDHFTSSLSIWMSSVSFSCLVVLARTCSIMFTKSSKSSHPCLISDLEEKLEVFTIQFVSCGHVIYSLYCTEVYFPILISLTVFIIEVLSNAFYQMPFLHQLWQSCDFSPSLCYYSVWHGFIFICLSIPVPHA